MSRIVQLFSGACLIAAIITLTGFLFSRNTGFAEFFDQHWELILAATGVLVLGLLVMALGARLFYSVEGAFMPFTVPISLAIVAAGGYLVYLGVRVVVDM